MKIRFVSVLALSVGVLLFADATSDWKAGLLAWRAHREQHVSAPDGWLTLVGLEWLKQGSNTVGSVRTIASGCPQPLLRILV
jgi:uncharacterized protein